MPSAKGIRVIKPIMNERFTVNIGDTLFLASFLAVIAPAVFASMYVNTKMLPRRVDPSFLSSNGCEMATSVPKKAISVPAFSFDVILSLKKIAPAIVIRRGLKVVMIAVSSMVVFSSPMNRKPREMLTANIEYRKI